MFNTSTTYKSGNELPIMNLYGICRCASLKLALEKIWSLDKLSCLCREFARQPRQKVLFAYMQATKSTEKYMRQWRNGRRTGFRLYIVVLAHLQTPLLFKIFIYYQSLIVSLTSKFQSVAHLLMTPTKTRQSPLYDVIVVYGGFLKWSRNVIRHREVN
jgi:hypothetical protein